MCVCSCVKYVLAPPDVKHLKIVVKILPRTVEPRYNDPRYNDIPGIKMEILCPSKGYSKIYGEEPRNNDLRYNDNPDITMTI